MEHLSAEEMDERQRLGLVRDSVGGVVPPPAAYSEDEEDEVYNTSSAGNLATYKPGF